MLRMLMNSQISYYFIILSFNLFNIENILYKVLFFLKYVWSFYSAHTIMCFLFMRLFEGHWIIWSFSDSGTSPLQKTLNCLFLVN